MDAGERPLRITIVTGPWFPPPPGPAGAVERVWGDLAHRFARRGHRVTVLCRSWDKASVDEERDGVLYRRRTSLNQSANVYWDIAKDLWYSIRMFLLLRPADILVTNAFWLPILARWFRRSAGRVTMNVQRVPKGQFWLYSRVDRLSTVSTAIRDAIVRERPSLGPLVRVIPNPIAIDVFRPPTPERDFERREGRRIVFTGRIHPEKGLHVLVEAFRTLRAERPDLALRLIGPSRIDRGGGGPEYVDRLRRLAGDAPLTIDEPIYDREALARALWESTCYCYPSLAEQGEAPPVAPMEAMATALPIVVSDIPQFRDYMTPGVEGEVFDHRSADNVASLARALASIIDHPDRARAMGRAARVSAERFGYEQVATMYLDDFRSLLGGTHG